MRPSDKEIQIHVANLAIGASTVRGPGNTGVALAARGFLANLHLGRFAVSGEQEFITALDATTTDLVEDLPQRARHWGIARKCTNIFLRDAFYNRFLSQPLLASEAWFEIPLDSVVADALREKDMALPKWAGVKHLTPERSSAYQESAKRLAEVKGYPRVYLDSVLWPQGRK